MLAHGVAGFGRADEVRVVPEEPVPQRMEGEGVVDLHLAVEGLHTKDRALLRAVPHAHELAQDLETHRERVSDH